MGEIIFGPKIRTDKWIAWKRARSYLFIKRFLLWPGIVTLILGVLAGSGDLFGIGLIAIIGAGVLTVLIWKLEFTHHINAKLPFEEGEN